MDWLWRDDPIGCAANVGQYFYEEAKGFLGAVETAARRGGFLEAALTALGPLGLQVDSCRTRSWQYCTARFVTTQLIDTV